MHMRRLLLGLLAFAFVGMGWADHSHAQPANISQKVGVCDPKFGSNCIKPLADGSININGTISLSNYALETTQVLNKADLDALVAAAAVPAQVVGAAANGASVTGNPVLDGCRAATATPTAVTDGQAAMRECDALGAAVVRPYAIKELQVRGSTGATTTNTQVSIIASAGGSLRNYITAIQCSNSGASTSILTFTDDATTVLINPLGSGGSWTFPVPLRTAAATAFQVTFGTASTSQYCSAQGYTGL